MTYSVKCETQCILDATMFTVFIDFQKDDVHERLPSERLNLILTIRLHIDINISRKCCNLEKVYLTDGVRLGKFVVDDLENYQLRCISL